MLRVTRAAWRIHREGMVRDGRLQGERPEN